MKLVFEILIFTAVYLSFQCSVLAEQKYKDLGLDFLKFYETTTTHVTEDLDYSNRQRRSLRNVSVSAKKFYTVSFHAFKMDFKVVLDRTSLLSKDLKLTVYEFKGKPPVTAPVVTNRYYQGYLQGESHGHLRGLRKIILFDTRLNHFTTLHKNSPVSHNIYMPLERISRKFSHLLRMEN